MSGPERQTGATLRAGPTRRCVALTLLLLTLGALGCGGGAGADDRRSNRDGAAPERSGAVAAVESASTPLGSSPVASTARKEGAAECAPRRLRVLFVGTSLTAGYGLEQEQAYPALLQRMADSAGYSLDIVNAGVSGETSAAALRRAEWIFRAPADVVVLETGANDGLRALEPDATRANIVATLAKARAAHPEARLLLVQMEAPPNLGAGYTSRFRAVFPAAAREGGATLVPFLLEGVAGVAALNQGDGIHPNVAGARRVAANLWPSIAEAAGALDPCQHRD